MVSSYYGMFRFLLSIDLLLPSDGSQPKKQSAVSAGGWRQTPKEDDILQADRVFWFSGLAVDFLAAPPPGKERGKQLFDAVNDKGASFIQRFF